MAEDGTGGFYYVHKLRKGVNRQSHALKVARLAGLPESAIEVARQVLADTDPHVGNEHPAQHFTNKPALQATAG